jgi:hypothetical protein
MTATKIVSMSTKFLGNKITVYRLFKNSELVGVYATQEEAEAAKAAL